MMYRICYKLHKILGSLLSILFVLWFLTGFVMIFHNFPKISSSEQNKGLYKIDTSYTAQIELLLQQLPQDIFVSLSLKGNAKGEPIIHYSTASEHRILSLTGTSTRYNYLYIKDYATKLNSSAVIKVDTVCKKDCWLPYDKYEVDFPAYKFYFDDEEKSELYVSSLTGEGIQYSNTETRFWAWVGAIPHWLYIANLRHYTESWKTTVIVLSGVGSAMCLLGLMIAARLYCVRKRLKSPYRKFAYKWHHILGFTFGVFIFTFAFSGMMSLQKMPQWIVKTHNQELVKKATVNPIEKPLYRTLSHREILKENKGCVQKIEWAQFGEKPYYKVVMNDSIWYIDASAEPFSPLALSEAEVLQRIALLQPEKATTTLMREYDNYYIHKRTQFPLPVYKVKVDDEDKSIYYINPSTAEVRYFNTNTRARKWTYQALHSFSIKWLLDRPLLWNILMWTTMIGGTFVSITGIVLAYRYAMRRKKRKKRG